MLVNYDNKEYTFDLDDVTVAQLREIYTHCGGLTLATLETGLQEGHPNALTAIYWLMLENNGETSSIQTVNFKVVKFFKALQDASIEQEAELKAAEEAETARTGAPPKDEPSAETPTSE